MKTSTGQDITAAARSDAGELWTLQLACWVQEAIDNDTLDIPPLHENLDDIRAGLASWLTFVVREDHRLIGSVRGKLTDGPDGDRAWEIGRLMVAPDQQGKGWGRALLEHIQCVAPPEAESFVLFTGAYSHDNLRLYGNAGYVVRTDVPVAPGLVMLTKPRT